LQSLLLPITIPGGTKGEEGMAGYETSDSEALTDDLRDRIAAELEPGERLVWAARPKAGTGVGCGLKAILILGILPTAAGAGLILWAVQGRPDEFVAVGVVLIAVGAFLTVVTTWANRINRRMREGTLYALTDRRAITWVPEYPAKVAVKSFYPPDLRSVYRKESPDGSGDLILEEATTPGPKGVPATVAKGFLGIDRVREVEQLVRDTLLRQGNA
jgi:hypothetical protein